ncbi:MAG: hypothetical protein A2V88_09095 [Elusimicrobia bacterium RBG_16_66_12]|nr:MAG: hypothetical protein A2V88_09095 [Elusimicrobia bacterium RBG_16_66_12]
MLLMISCLGLIPVVSRADPVIQEAAGSACMGDDKSRKNAEAAALEEAKRNSSEQAWTFIISQSEVKDFQLGKDQVKSYSSASVKVLEELGRQWYEDESLGPCFKIEIRAEVTPDESSLQALQDAMAEAKKFAGGKIDMPEPSSVPATKPIDVEDYGKVYLRVLQYQCSSRSHTITDKGAQEIAALAAEGKIDVDEFLKAYRRTCSYDSAVKVGMGSISKTLSAEAYHDVLQYQCSSRSRTISDRGAQDVATSVARGEIDVSVFLEVYRRTCSFDSAMAVAGKRGLGSQSRTPRVMPY